MRFGGGSFLAVVLLLLPVHAAGIPAAHRDKVRAAPTPGWVVSAQVPHPVKAPPTAAALAHAAGSRG